MHFCYIGQLGRQDGPRSLQFERRDRTGSSHLFMGSAGPTPPLKDYQSGTAQKIETYVRYLLEVTIDLLSIEDLLPSLHMISLQVRPHICFQCQKSKMGKSNDIAKDQCRWGTWNLGLAGHRSFLAATARWAN